MLGKKPRDHEQRARNEGETQMRDQDMTGFVGRDLLGKNGEQNETVR